ncbi:hypothetical protein B0T22DRAFT_136292 [Podospora appendiculata]|uniref:Uncharacterized protein n=1 Tax=Podospora appendiculata TaxID=314037 RepID=A0AAE0X7Y1_9PEZI|nr:hypothetical protein B0T22DRAFT_136292 [Podospora appendiculata]
MHPRDLTPFLINILTTGISQQSICSLLTIGALLFTSSSLAAPVDPDAGATNTTTASPATVPDNAKPAADNGTPHCKSSYLYDLCTSSNAGAYCDVTGFHNNFMTSCKAPNCWCE